MDVVVDALPPHLNVATYVSRYTGPTKLRRLMFICENFPELRGDALLALHTELKTGFNTELFLKMREASVDSTLFSGDESWIEMTERTSNQTLSRLESDLATSKTTMVKESIRLGYMEIGHFYTQRGNLNNALKAYIRTRDYCTTPRHTLDMCICVISVAIELGQFTTVSTYISKADLGSADEVSKTKVRASMGLVAINDGDFKAAARNFLDISAGAGGYFSNVIATEDIALYGA